MSPLAVDLPDQKETTAVGISFGSRRRRAVMGRFGLLSNLDRTSATAVLRFLAEEAGTTVVEAAVVSIRTMELADATPPEEASFVLNEVTREFVSGRLRFPVSNRPLHTSCHPAHAVQLVLIILENLRPTYYQEVGTPSRLPLVGAGSPHLTLVPPLV